MNELIPIRADEHGTLSVDSMAIAEGTGVQHKNVVELVRHNFADFEEFGRVAFETRPFETAGGVQHREVALLNEQQATLLLTYMRNSEIVRRFKKALVKAFYEMAQALRASQPAAELSEEEIVHRALQITVRQVKELEAVNAELTPKAQAWDSIVSSAGSWSYEEAAKVLFEQGVVMIGQNRLVKQLMAWEYLYRDAKGRPHVYQKYVEQGLFVARARTYVDTRTGEARESSAPQVRITGKGLDMLFRRFQMGRLPLPAPMALDLGVLSA